MRAIHVAPAELEKTIRRMKDNLRGGSSGSSEDECYVRLAELVATGFIRWQIGELNRGADEGDMGHALVQTVAWMIGQAAAGAKDDAARLGYVALICAAVHTRACEFAAGGFDPNGDIFASVEEGGHA